PGPAESAVLRAQLALLSGWVLLGFGIPRLGSMAHFPSHPAISGFITGSAFLIAVGQLPHLLGLRVAASGVFDHLAGLAGALPEARPATLAIGLASLLFLLGARRLVTPRLGPLGASPATGTQLTRPAPMRAGNQSTH